MSDTQIKASTKFKYVTSQSLKGFSRPLMLLQLFSVLVLSLLFSSPASAEYWGTSAQTKQADMAMQDIQLSYFADTTYHAFWHTRVNSRTRKGVGAFFYAGSAYNAHNNPEKYGKNIYQWSFWYKGIKGGEKREQNITPLWGYPSFHLSNVVGEGANARMGGVYPLKAKQWYRHVMKFWSPSDKEEASKFTYAGWWMKDLDGDNQWRQLGLVKIPYENACFEGSGLGGFIEGFANNGGMNIRTQSSRNLYTRKDRQWESCDFKSSPKRKEEIKITHTSGEYAMIEILGRPFKGSKPHTERHTLKVNKTETPPMGKLALSQVKAIRKDGNILVSWKLAKSSTPQVQTTIQILSESQATPVFTHHSDQPQVNQVYLELTPQQAKLARFVNVITKDIFDRTVSEKVAIDSPQQLVLASAKIDKPVNGISISYYQLDKALSKRPATRHYANWDKLPDLSNLSLTRTVYTNHLSLDSRPRDYGFVAKIHSYLKIDQEGLYRFHFKAFQGGQIKIGDTILSKQDQHGSNNTVRGTILLKPGFHPVEIQAYTDDVNKYGLKLALEYEGPGLARVKIPSSQWHLPQQEMITDKISCVIRPGSGSNRNQLQFELDSVAKSKRKIVKVEVINPAGEVWLTTDTFPVKSSIFLPEGDHLFRPRIHYENNIVLDLEDIKTSSQNPVPKGWELADPKKSRRPFGHRLSSEEIILMGDGRRRAMKKVKGDFTFTMRVRTLTNAIGKTGKSPYATFGFIASEVNDTRSKKSFRWSYGRYYKGRYEVPSKSFHGLNNRNWKASGHEFTVGGHFRFSRKGDVFKIEIKNLGKDWQTLSEGTAKLTEELMIGPYASQTTTVDPKSFYRTEFDQIKINQEKK